MNTHPKIIGFVVVTLGILSTVYLITEGIMLLYGIKPDPISSAAFSHVGDSITGAFLALLVNTRSQQPPPPDTAKEVITKEVTSSPEKVLPTDK